MSYYLAAFNSNNNLKKYDNFSNTAIFTLFIDIQ